MYLCSELTLVMVSLFVQIQDVVAIRHLASTSDQVSVSVKELVPLVSVICSWCPWFQGYVAGVLGVSAM